MATDPLRQASKDLSDDHFRGPLQHTAADRGDFAADRHLVLVFQACVAIFQFDETHLGLALGRTHRAAAGTGQTQ
ncbi:hypothetical protein D3C81_1761530 [compost metagenome]